MTEYNTNKNLIFINDFSFGKETIILKIGRKKYYLDIDKNNVNSFISLYNYVDSNRDNFSKYDSNAKICSLCVKNNAMLDRDFFEKMPAMCEAVEVLKRSGHYTTLIL